MCTWGLMLNLFLSVGMCSQISASGSLLATSEKVDKSLQFLKTERKILGKI